MKQTPAFRSMTAADLPALALIAAAAPDPWREADLKAELEKPESAVTLLCKNGAPAAFACFWREEDTVELAMLAVDAACRRQGFGALLLAHCLEKQAAAGAARAVLEVRTSNAAALALYEKLGFYRLAVRKQLYAAPREDGFLMEKSLITE
jgi:ribosomal-protein-alanine N-acetyltransferase